MSKHRLRVSHGTGFFLYAIFLFWLESKEPESDLFFMHLIALGLCIALGYGYFDLSKKWKKKRGYTLQEKLDNHDKAMELLREGRGFRDPENPGIIVPWDN